MGIYKKWEGKSSGSTSELQEKFPEKAIPNDAKIGKKNGEKNLSNCPKFLNLEIRIKSWLGFFPGIFRALSSARVCHGALWDLLCPGKILSEMNELKPRFSGPPFFPPTIPGNI